MAVNALLLALMAGGTGSLVALRVYAGVTAPEIPPGELRKAAKAFRELADDLDKGDEAIATRANAAASKVWLNNSGEGVDAFSKLYLTNLRFFPYAFANDCRVIAVGCEAYARMVEDVRERFVELEKAIMQLLWLVAFQPLTTALYGVAQAMAAAQLARLVKLAQVLKSVFLHNVARILRLTFPKYVLTTLNYAAVDGAAYAAGSMAADASVDVAHGRDVDPSATEFGKIVTANTGYILGYDAAKLALPGPATRGGELAARLFGSGFGYTPVKSALDGDGTILPTGDEWIGELEGHGMRALIFPPGWRYR
ncbi:hypothetical protein ACIBKY_54170 [Nonomuraea sp. NPDC050394]|uniref:WXG100-like domain-containing protein n=1 Tax=Nonomuraea sp. NPDC050394 TaxID=3364363 RepID=UPI003799C14E